MTQHIYIFNLHGLLNFELSSTKETYLVYADSQKLPTINRIVTCRCNALTSLCEPHVLRLEHSNFFNMKYFEDQVVAAEWDEVERYLCGFTKLEDNRYSLKIFFEIRKQKYYEALDRNDRARAVEILRKDLKVFSTYNEELYKELTLLITLENIRENEQLSEYGDTKSQRSVMLGELKKLIEANPTTTKLTL